MNASTRLAALPELPTAARKRPRSFLSFQAARNAARSIVRILSRMPTAARSFSAASATVKNGGVEPLWVSGLGEELARLRGIVRGWRGLEREVHHPGDDDAGRRAVAEAR